MENKKIALILIDSNGQYDKKKKKHCTMKNSMVDESFYTILINEIQSGKYNEILYNMNLPECTKKEEIEEALRTDPVLSRLNDEYRKKVKVFMGGYNLSSEFDTGGEGIKFENKLAEEGYEFVIGGLYYDWCVETHEKNLRCRYPDIKTFRPEYLSKWSSLRAKDEYISGCNFGKIGLNKLGRRTVPRVSVPEMNFDFGLTKPLEAERYD